MSIGGRQIEAPHCKCIVAGIQTFQKCSDGLQSRYSNPSGGLCSSPTGSSHLAQAQRIGDKIAKVVVLWCLQQHLPVRKTGSLENLAANYEAPNHQIKGPVNPRPQSYDF